MKRVLCLSICLMLSVLAWISPLSAATSLPTALSFSADGKTVGGGDDFGGLSLWSSTGALLKRFPGHGDRVHGVTFRGTQLISWARDDSVIITDVLTGKQSKLQAPKGIDISRGVVNPRGDRLATLGGQSAFLLWDLGSLKAKSLDGRGNSLGTDSLCFSADGKLLAAGIGQSVILFDGLSGERLRKIALGADFADFGFTAEGTLLTLDPVKDLREWQPSTGQLLGKQPLPFSGLDLRLSPDGRGVLVVGGNWVKGHQTWVCPDLHNKELSFVKTTRLVGFCSAGGMVELPPPGAGYAKILKPDGSPEKKFTIIDDSVLGTLGIPDLVVLSPAGNTLAIGGYKSLKFYPLTQK